MLFHTVLFSIFLPLVIFLALVAPRALLYPLLIIASYVFYGWGAGFYILLLAGTSMMDFAIALQCHGKPERRRYGIILSGVVNFGVLAYFKYANFAISNVDAVLTSFGLDSQISTINVILPIGISFYIFQSFAYVVDVLTDKIKPCRSLQQYLLFSSWFPQLIAGPISRASMLIPQLEKITQLRAGLSERLPQAAILFAEGWLRKAFADMAAISANFFYMQDPSSAGGAAAWYAVVAFGIQIYGDFSGYSRMAQGISWLFGIKLMDNFNIPYAADSVRDFWRRWHISLSLWFRDYVYIPLGGNQYGVSRMYMNLALTMMLCGLWHGANWTFILWGGMHGALLILERIGGAIKMSLPKFVRHFVVLVLVFLAWVPFRADDIESTFLTYSALFNPGWYLPPLSLVFAVAGIVACDISLKTRSSVFTDTLRSQIVPVSVWLASCVIIWQIGQVVGRQEAAAFIYFQF
jgi:alginate O-acetyltransferase complex protein AlgI